MADPIPGPPIQIQLPPVLQDIMQQYPLMVQRIVALEAKPVPAVVLPAWLVALAAFSLGILCFLAGQVAWSRWGN